MQKAHIPRSPLMGGSRAATHIIFAERASIEGGGHRVEILSHFSGRRDGDRWPTAQPNRHLMAGT